MSDKEEEKRECIGSLKIGDKITFGSYPFYEDGREKPIDWVILDIDADNNALVISDYALDFVCYNEWVDEITWENSTIRKWLNETFIKSAFTEEQRSRIIESRIENKYNAAYGTKGGNATRDKLFLLSIEESNRYLKSKEARIAYSTPYAKSNKSVNGKLLKYGRAFKDISTYPNGSCYWWLRSPGGDVGRAARVDQDGLVHSYGLIVAHIDVAVRPAFKINLNSF